MKFKRDELVECKNEALIELLQNCVDILKISYLKSFKIQDDDFDNDNDEEDDDEDDEDEYHIQTKRRKFRSESIPKKNYFHFIKYAIQNASIKSSHVNMQPVYGYDITPSSGHLLDQNGGFIETTLPQIKPPFNDFHTNLMKD